MAEGGTRPIAAKLYEAPSDSGRSPGSTYTPPGVPAPRETEATLGIRRNSPETASDSHRSDPTPPVGTRVAHRVSGATGEVVGHSTHGYGTAAPTVRWDGEEASTRVEVKGGLAGRLCGYDFGEFTNEVAVHLKECPGAYTKGGMLSVV